MYAKSWGIWIAPPAYDLKKEHYSFVSPDPLPGAQLMVGIQYLSDE